MGAILSKKERAQSENIKNVKQLLNGEVPCLEETDDMQINNLINSNLKLIYWHLILNRLSNLIKRSGV